MFHATSIVDALIQAFCFFLMRETYAPKILGNKARELRKVPGNEKLHTQWDTPDKTFLSILGINLIRPLRLLGTQPIVQVMAIYMAYLYANMFLVLASFPTLWTTRYGEALGLSGLNYVSLALGLLTGSLVCGPLSDKVRVNDSEWLKALINESPGQDMARYKKWRKNGTRIPLPAHDSWGAARPYWLFHIWLDSREPPPLDSAQHRRFHLQPRYDPGLPVYTGLLYRVLLTLRCVSHGCCSRSEVGARVRLSALCAKHV